MNITPVEIPLPAEYLPTGDHALIVAWAAVNVPEDDGGPAYEKPVAILCVEDGSAVIAGVHEFKFDYRYDTNRQRFVDVSGIDEGEDDNDGDSDQEPPSDGSEAVPGLVPETD